MHASQLWVQLTAAAIVKECDEGDLPTEIQKKKKQPGIIQLNLKRIIISFMTPPIVRPQFLFCVRIKLRGAVLYVLENRV